MKAKCGYDSRTVSSRGLLVICKTLLCRFRWENVVLTPVGVVYSYFEMTAEYCAQYGGLIPVVFVLGFYVNYVASRWWEKFKTIPWPGSCAMLVTVNLHGHDEKARLMRRTVMRYVCLSFVMTMASISPPVKKRFPTWQHMVDAGLLYLVSSPGLISV